MWKFLIDNLGSIANVASIVCGIAILLAGIAGFRHWWRSRIRLRVSVLYKKEGLLSLYIKNLGPTIEVCNYGYLQRGKRIIVQPMTQRYAKNGELIDTPCFPRMLTQSGWWGDDYEWLVKDEGLPIVVETANKKKWRVKGL